MGAEYIPAMFSARIAQTGPVPPDIPVEEPSMSIPALLFSVLPFDPIQMQNTVYCPL